MQIKAQKDSQLGLGMDSLTHPMRSLTLVLKVLYNFQGNTVNNNIISVKETDSALFLLKFLLFLITLSLQKQYNECVISLFINSCVSIITSIYSIQCSDTFFFVGDTKWILHQFTGPDSCSFIQFSRGC